MGRNLEKDAIEMAAKNQRILENGFRIFSERGIDTVTMNDVATFSGYSGLTPIINSSNINSTIGVDDKRTYPLYHTYTIGVSVGF